MRTVLVSLPARPVAWRDSLEAAARAAGLAPEFFASDGAGGRALEARVRSGGAAGVLELSTAELAAQLAGGPHAGGIDRLTAAASLGVPQLVTPCGLDCLWDGGGWVPLTEREADRAGLDLAQKLCASRGPVELLWPAAGFSALFPERSPATGVLRESVGNWLAGVPVAASEHAADGEAFALEALARLLGLMGWRG